MEANLDGSLYADACTRYLAYANKLQGANDGSELSPLICRGAVRSEGAVRVPSVGKSGEMNAVSASNGLGLMVLSGFSVGQTAAISEDKQLTDLDRGRW